MAFLQGERKGQENLKADLVRRIKMLEYALKQERWAPAPVLPSGKSVLSGSVGGRGWLLALPPRQGDVGSDHQYCMVLGEGTE